MDHISGIRFTQGEPHTLSRERSAGRLYVGPKKQPASISSLLVDPGEPLNWEVLEELPQDGAYPWPRMIDYQGHDTSLFTWAITRPVEGITWMPDKELVVDMQHARISDLTIELRQAPLTLRLPECLRSLRLEGDLGLLRLIEPAPSSLDVVFCDIVSSSVNPPRVPGLLGVASFHMYGPNPPDGAAIAAYQDIEELCVCGGVVQARNLASLGRLRVLELRACYDLRELPPLESWPHLELLYVNEVDSESGKRLQRQAKALPLLKATVSGLRSPSWVALQANAPFKQWKGARLKMARAAIKACGKALDKAGGVAQKEAEAITAYIQRFNEFDEAHGFDTVEREEIIEALFTLSSDEEKWERWFVRVEAARRF